MVVNQLASSDRTPASDTTDRRLVIFAHGSTDPLWRQPFVELTEALEAQLGKNRVRLAYMEFCSPTLLDVAEEACRDQSLALLILPFFLASGAHYANDIPAQIATAQKHYPQLRFHLAPPIGSHARVQSLFREIACEYIGAAHTDQAANSPRT